MNRFRKELEIGEIHQRDQFQFELKSEFIPVANLKNNYFTQEFYFFIPNSLQVNQDTYSNSQFYKDQTNLIRYKTPEFTLRELCSPSNTKSPLTRLLKYCESQPNQENVFIVEEELKLLGNVVRSSIRERVRKLVDKLDNKSFYDNTKPLQSEAQQLCEDLVEFRKRYLEVQADFSNKWTSVTLQNHFLYIDEFVSDSINYYLTGMLDRLRRSNLQNRDEVGIIIGNLLATEKRHREEILKEPTITDEDTVSNEYILYRSSLLNKYVLDALLLNTTRSSVAKRFRNLIGSIAAGIAMLFFFVLFVKGGSVFIINSSPFILLTVLLYILKDRIKESLKTLSYRQFAKWFSDYKTEITSPSGSTKVGKMEEYFSFVREDEVPEEITRMRNREFHVVLETFKRPEQVLYYKKKITLYHTDTPPDARRKALNIIFRFNISQFLIKADNPTHQYVTVDPETLEFFRAMLPKVYHLNIILKNTYFEKEKGIKTEFRKYRLILDKNGIKRVEHILT